MTYNNAGYDLAKRILGGPGAIQVEQEDGGSRVLLNLTHVPNKPAINVDAVSNEGDVVAFDLSRKEVEQIVDYLSEALKNFDTEGN